MGSKFVASPYCHSVGLAWGHARQSQRENGRAPLGTSGSCLGVVKIGGRARRPTGRVRLGGRAAGNGERSQGGGDRADERSHGRPGAGAATAEAGHARHAPLCAPHTSAAPSAPRQRVAQQTDAVCWRASAHSRLSVPSKATEERVLAWTPECPVPALTSSRRECGALEGAGGCARRWMTGARRCCPSSWRVCRPQRATRSATISGSHDVICSPMLGCET